MFVVYGAKKLFENYLLKNELIKQKPSEFDQSFTNIMKSKISSSLNNSFTRKYLLSGKIE